MKTLIVVDMQTDFIDGALGSKEAEKIAAEKAAARARKEAEQAKPGAHGVNPHKVNGDQEGNA